jgi:hypothetical protein
MCCLGSRAVWRSGLLERLLPGQGFRAGASEHGSQAVSRCLMVANRVGGGIRAADYGA